MDYNYYEENEKQEKISKGIKIGLGILGIIIVIGCLFAITKPIRADFSRKTDILKYLNNKSTNNISKETLTLEKKIKSIGTDNKWKITSTISDYINKMDWASTLLSDDLPEEKLIIQSLKFDDSNENLTLTKLPEDCSFLMNTFTKNDIKKVKNKIFYSDLVSSLEKIFIHESTNPAFEWYINKEQAEKTGKKVSENQWNFDLPYNCTATFTQSKCEPTNYKFIDAKWYKQTKESDRYELELTYIDEEGETQTLKSWFKFEHKDWLHKRDMTINIYGSKYKFSKADFIIYANQEATEANNLEVKEVFEEDGIIWEKVDNNE